MPKSLHLYAEISKWKHPAVPKIIVILAGHDGDDAKPYQEKEVREFLWQIAEKRRRTQR